MSILIRPYTQDDLPEMISVWNRVVEDGIAFPQEETLDYKRAQLFFAEQSYTGVAEEEGEIVGLYILHPNNIGRCGHIANSSYAVKASHRGRHIGEHLVTHSIEKATSLLFKILQFIAVVATNKGAILLYKKLGFTPLGTIPGGFRMSDGTYEDIIPFYITLANHT